MRKALLLLALFTVFAPLQAAAQNNSLAVTSAAAMGTSSASATCEGDGQPGPCGLEMRYEPGSNTRARIVQSGFGPENVFRERFWMDVSNFHPNRFTRNFYHTATGLFNNQLLPTYRSDIVLKSGLNYAVGAGAYDNQRNRVGLTRCSVPGDAPFQVQIEWTAGCSPTKGIFKMTVFDQNDVEICTRQAQVQNCLLNVNRFNFETLVEGGIEMSGPVYIDQYEAYRTLAP